MRSNKQKIEDFVTKASGPSSPLGDRSKRGTILVTVLIIGVFLLVMITGLISISTHQTRDRVRYETYKDEFAAGEVALNKAFAHIQFLVTQRIPNLNSEINNTPPPSVEGYDFTEFDITAGTLEVQPGTGAWAGYDTLQQSFEIDVTTEKTEGTATWYDHSGVRLRQTLTVNYIPLYGFAIFYDPIMEIAPGPAMDIIGRVHCNGDAYFSAGNSLDCHENVSIAGNFYHGTLADGKSPASGDVRFTDGEDLVSMENTTYDPGGWLDSRDDNWAAGSADTWGYGLRDGATGAHPLRLPIPPTLDPHDIIERASASDDYSLRQEKFEYKADLIIEADSSGNITAKNKAGNSVGGVSGIDPDSGNPAWMYESPSGSGNFITIATINNFYDAREGQDGNGDIASLDLDIGALDDSGFAPSNGIVYMSNEDQGSRHGAVRLVNGADLPDSPYSTGFSVMTDDPMYIQGDFNTVDKTLSMVASDALYILSNAWDDANSADWSARRATQTTINAVCMHGNVPTDGSDYSGGVENNFRFLEDWGSRNLNFNGSVIIMWNSESALGKWKYGKPIYKAPNRIWSWDTALGGSDGPPGAPSVIEITRGNWEMPPADI